MTAWPLDVNLLIPLVDSAHTHHERAFRWFEQHRGDCWATRPIAENGFVRVLSDRKYPNLSFSPKQASLPLVRLKTGSSTHEWWPDDVRILICWGWPFDGVVAWSALTPDCPGAPSGMLPPTWSGRSNSFQHLPPQRVAQD